MRNCIFFSRNALVLRLRRSKSTGAATALSSISNSNARASGGLWMRMGTSSKISDEAIGVPFMLLLVSSTRRYREVQAPHTHTQPRRRSTHLGRRNFSTRYSSMNLSVRR